MAGHGTTDNARVLEGGILCRKNSFTRRRSRLTMKPAKCGSIPREKALPHNYAGASFVKLPVKIHDLTGVLSAKATNSDFDERKQTGPNVRLLDFNAK